MTSDSAPRPPPIKLRLSLGSKPGPSTPTPASAVTPHTTSSRKGKGKADQNGTSTPSLRLKAPAAAATSWAPQCPQQIPDAGPSNIRLSFPRVAIAPQRTPSPLIIVPSPRSESSPPPVDLTSQSPAVTPADKTPKRGGTSTIRPKGRKRQDIIRSSAVPGRLIISDPTRHIGSPSPPADPTPDPDPQPAEGSAVEIEPVAADEVEAEADPLLLKATSIAMEVSTPNKVGEQVEQPATGRRKGGGRWMRLKRPLKELLGRIMVELRKKDDYALFVNPVNLDDLPDYLDIVGGEDKMMDMGTMQSKFENGKYRNLDQLEADLRTLVTAAETFNPPGTVPHTSASRLLAHGMKHIDRARPLVITPSPSPERCPSDRAMSTSSGREMTAATEDAAFRRPLSSISPLSYIPEEMLVFPPNSLHALAVGWNLNGGKRYYAKRQIRGREKFSGKWRHWDLDGSRDLAEMDDPDATLETGQVHRGVRRTTDWRGMRKDAWWSWDGLGGPNGKSPLPMVHLPRPPRQRSRELGAFEWGVYPEITAEMAYLANRTGVADEEEVISEHLRPMRPEQAGQPSNFTNIYDHPIGRGAWDWVRDVCTGDVRGEAYITSVERFVAGAMRGTKRPEHSDEKEEMPLDAYVREHWHNGVLSSTPRSIVQNTLASLQNLHSLPPTHPEKPHLVALARNAYHRLALRTLTSPSNPLDIAMLLREPDDFLYQGIGGKNGVQLGLSWAADEISRLNVEITGATTNRKRSRPVSAPDETGTSARTRPTKKLKLGSSSSPLTAPPDSPPSPAAEAARADAEPTLSTEAALRRLRLELVALSKFYPLAALRKMDKAQAERLLPENVRRLMSR